LTDLPPPGVNSEFELRFSQGDFDVFARISGDDNPIHVDPDFSGRTRFGRTVAHGMLLFGHFTAAAARWIGGPIHLLDQRLTFTAPTFAEDDLRLQLHSIEAADETVTVTQQLVGSDGLQTAAGTSVIARSRQELPADRPAGARTPTVFKGIEVGMRASMTRAFTSSEVAEFCRLVDDPNPLYVGRGATVPTALVGGVVSCLLGVELPGPGANWLKQHYRFLHPVSVGQELLTAVEVSRLRPDKALVDLHNAASVDGAPVMTGETLVLAADVADRSP